VAENIFLENAPRTGGPDRLAAHGAKARALLEELDRAATSTSTPRSAASRSPAASASRIAKAISQDPRVLVMDEPTTSLAKVTSPG